MSEMNENLEYFRNVIQNPDADTLPLPDAQAREEDFDEAILRRPLPDGLKQDLEAFAGQTGIDLTALYEAAAMLLLAKFSGSSDALCALVRAEKRFPVYCDFHKETSFTGCCRAVNAQADEAARRIDTVGFDALCAELELSAMPVLTEDEGFFNDFALTGSGPATALCLLLDAGNDSLGAKYNAARYGEDMIGRLLDSLTVVLQAIAAGEDDTGAIDILSDAQRAELDGFNETDAPMDAAETLIDRIDRAAERFPDNIAVVYKDKRYTYRAFSDLTDRIAAYLRRAGLGREDVVSILIPRCEYMPICAVGVLKSGAAYQPLDPSYPPERLAFMMQDAGAKFLIADKTLLSLVPEYDGPVLTLDEIPALPACEEILPRPKPENLFILLYTSGSTGTPKGVMLEHGNLAAFCCWFTKYYEMDENSRAAAYASFGFDACMMDMYPTLSSGAQLHIIAEDIRLDLIAIHQYLTENQVTHIFMTTQVGRQYAELFPDGDYPKYLSLGGETLVPVQPPSYRFSNAYGPTECTIFTTVFPVDRLYRNVPIGKPLSNVRLYILDAQGRRVPVGVPGELCISGPQVSRGYLNRPEQTAQAFVKNPFCGDPRFARMYRTGDIVRFLPDGSVEFIGRRDSQVKIRGFRIELSEVEGVIRQFEGIKDATVVAYDEAGGGKYVAAYVVADEPVDIEALNRFIRETKPPYMVPAVTMQIDRIPLNQNQKVNKRALPKPERHAAAYAAPATDAQKKICELLAGVVGHTSFGADTDFFEAGLTSVGSIKFLVLLTNAFGAAVSSKTLREYNTAQKLEGYLNTAEKTAASVRRDRYPLTQTQMGIYVECMKHPEAVFYNLPGVFPLSRDTDIEKLRDAVARVVDAHPAVKCAVRADEEGQVCMFPQDDRSVDVDVVRGTEEEYEAFFKGFARPFDFEHGPLYRFAVFVTDEHVYLVLDFHHIISNGSSIAVFAQELDRALRGQELLGEPYSQFDLAADEEKARKGESYRSAKNYYDGVFKGVSGCTTPERDIYEEQERCGFVRVFSDRLSPERVEAFCREKRITPNVFFLSLMSFVLGRYEHTEEVCLTTIYNGRSDGRTAATMGMLVKTLPVYAEPTDNRGVADYLNAMQEQILSSMSNDIYSFAEISHAYGIQSDVMFVYQGDDFVEFDLGGQKTVFAEGVPDVAKSQLSIDLFVEKGRYRFEFEYRADMYSPAFIDRLTHVLEEAAISFLTARTLGDVNLTPADELERIEGFNDTDYPVELVSVNRLFEGQAAAHPDRLALIAAGEKLTYDALNRAANRVARALIALGVGKDQIIGLILERDKYDYIVNLGILKAGAAFLPMTPSYPDERIEYCLTDAQSPFVITTESIRTQRSALWEGKPYRVLTVETLLAAEEEENPDRTIDVDALAYCLYTSGSTGKPKGVMIEHRNLCNFVNANPRNIEITNYTNHASVSLALAAITFDVSVMEEFIPLCNGLTVCMATEEEIHNPVALAKLMEENRVDFMTCTPSFLSNVIDLEQMRGAIAYLKAFDFGAEAFPPALYGKIRAINPTAFIANGYGPTECTVSCSTKFLNDTDKITIGVPLSNVKFYVMDSGKHVLPVGFKGELVICGAGVGRGYVNLPDKTREAFFHMKGLKAYHSGDLARWTEKGEIDFLGRLDNQVKLRGLRVELDEIESAINAYEGVRMSKVIVRNNGSEDYLAGYFTADRTVDLADLTARLRETLTAYMVPGALMQLDEMPLTPNGKTDKKLLPDIQYAAAQREYVAPSSELEAEFCEQFAKILGLERVGATDDFFEIGGTSLSATRIAMYALNKGYPIAYKDVFACPTPAMLAGLAAKGRGGSQQAEDTNVNAYDHAAAGGRPEKNAETQADSVGRHGYAAVSGRLRKNAETQADGADTYDYTAINELLEKNAETRLAEVLPGRLGNILLTGATGFLGIHVLREFLNNYTGKVYCLMRRGRHAACEKRLMSMLDYYFSDPCEEAFRDRIVCVEGDITDREAVAALADLDCSVVINCAACVKHFVSDDSLDRINVGGVENLVAMCRASGKRFVQISTTSVAGEGDERTSLADKRMGENELYFGQILDNAYVHSKFLAERTVLEACAQGGLDGRILRVGNLMSRRSDGEFQINFVTNGFMRTLKAYKALGQFPMGAMHVPAEFSPIDSTAAAVLTLAACEGGFTVFHAYNSHSLYMSDVIYAMRAYGFAIDIVPDEVFAATLREASEHAELSGTVLGLIAYDSGDGSARYEIPAVNDFTARALYRLNYKWPITDDAYLENAIRALDTLGFFDNPRV